MSQKVYFTNSPAIAIDRYITDSGSPKTFILTDENTAEHVLPVFLKCSDFVFKSIEIYSGFSSYGSVYGRQKGSGHIDEIDSPLE